MATTTNSEEKPLAPLVLWAQRHDALYVTIEVEDIKDEKIELNETSLSFHGKSGVKTYEVQLDFLNEVLPKDSKQKKSGRGMFFNIKKKESGPYWSRLLSQKPKPHFLKIDFNRWKDEDDSEPEEEGGAPGQYDDRSLEDMMKQMSSGTQNIPDMDDLQGPDSDDSDDEDLPDLEDTGETKE